MGGSGIQELVGPVQKINQPKKFDGSCRLFRVYISNVNFSDFY